MSSPRIQGYKVINDPMEKIGLKPNIIGNCNGYIGAYLQDMVMGKYNQFVKKIDFICDTPDLAEKINHFLQEKMPESLEKNKYLLRSLNFFKTVKIYQQPESYIELNLNGKIIQHNYAAIADVAAPKALRAQGGLKRVYVDEMIYKPGEWCNYFENLRAILQEMKIEEKEQYNTKLGIVINLMLDEKNPDTKEIQQHTIGLTYNTELNQWILADINLLNSIPVSLPIQEMKEQECTKIGIDDDEFKKLLPKAIRNGNIINFFKVMYFKDKEFIPATIQIFTTGKNPRLDFVKYKFRKMKQLSHTQHVLSEISSRVTPMGNNVMHLAARYDDKKTIKWLLENKIDINHKNKLGETPLHESASYNSKKVMRLLTKLLSNEQLDVVTTNVKATPAMIAAENDYAEILEMLIKSGADAKKSNKNGYAPIHFSAKNNSLSSMRVLLSSRKIDVNQEALNDGTAACVAALEGNSSILKMLADAGADFTKTRSDNYAPIHLAAQENASSAMAIILDHDKRNIDQTTSRGTAACIAALRNHTDILCQLIRAGADLNKMINGLSPLSVATFYGNTQIVNLLLESKKLNIDKADSLGLTSLHIAAEKNHIQIARALLKAGANLELKQANDMTPLDLAKHYGHQEMIDLFVKEASLRSQTTNPHDLRLFSRKRHRASTAGENISENDSIKKAKPESVVKF